MRSPSPEDAVVVSVPAAADLVHLFRAVAASVAARLSLSYEAIEDLKLAVDEGCARLLEVGTGATRMRLRLLAFEDRLEAAVSIDGAAGPWPPPRIEETFSWRVLSALVDSVTLDLDGGEPTVRMSKSRLQHVASEAP